MKKKVLGKKHSHNDVNSVAEESFLSKRPNSVSPGSWPGMGHVDNLIDFLADNVNKLDTRNEYLAEFEKMTCEVIMKCADPDLHRIFKEQGWIGTQYQLSYDPPFIDAQSCLNALSNYYLKVNAAPAIHDISADSNIESQNLDQILPFCPDILVNYLKKQPITSSTKEPRRLTFKGACMLADISGFSKFSGAMCSKGVSGLDDLREATNGFLGYFVKQVYEYEGDVIAFAGDALICAFRNTSEGISESCFRALQCAHVLRQHKTAYLSTHIGVTCGEMQIALLGGHNDQWCYVMNGDCVSQLASCIEDAGSQEVAITAEVYEYAKIRDNARSLPVAYKHQLVVNSQRKPTGNYLLTNIAVKRNTAAMPPSPFDNPEQVLQTEQSGLGFSNMWGALRGQQVHHSHVHEVASDVLLKTRSDYMIKDESKRTGLASLGITEMFFGARTASQQQLITTTESNSAEHAATVTPNGPANGAANGVTRGSIISPTAKSGILRVDTLQTSPTRSNSMVTPTANSSTPVPSNSAATTPGSVSTVVSPSGRIVRKGSMQMESYKNNALGKKLHSQKEFARTAPAIKSRPLPLTPVFKAKPSALDMLEIKNEIPYNPRSPAASATYKREDGYNVSTFDMNLPIYDEPVERGLGSNSNGAEKALSVRFEPNSALTNNYYNNDSMYSLLGSVVSSNNSSYADMNAASGSNNNSNYNLPIVGGSTSNSNSNYNMPVVSNITIPPTESTPVPNGELTGVKAKIAMYENAKSPNNVSTISLQNVHAATPPPGRRFSRNNGIIHIASNNTNNDTTAADNNTNNTSDRSHTSELDTPVSPLTPLPPTPPPGSLPVESHTKHLPAHTPPPALTPPPSNRNHSNNSSYSSMTNSEIDLRTLLSPSNSDLLDEKKATKALPTPALTSPKPSTSTYTNPATATALISTLAPLAIANNNNNTNASNENSSVTESTTPISPTRALPNLPFSRANSMESQKRRFAGWGVMKNALRRESFRDKHGVTEVSYIQSISKFVPRPVLNAVHTECLDLIGELRQVTTLFCGLNSYDNETNKDPCTLQPFFLMAQTVLHEAGGFLRQFLVDDKGCVFIAMWGVPSFTYSNNCSRALYCAAKIREGSIALGHDVSIGIATGTVFCGSVGALERRDYAGVGTDVNMAARLMGKAKSRILIDKNTYKILNIDAQHLLSAAETMHLKGAAEPCTPFQYDSTELPSIVDIDVSTQNSVLRPAMQSALIRLLDSFMNVKTTAGTSELINKILRVTFCFIFGMPGTGKAQAVQYYRNTARLRSIKCIHLIARADSQGIPYGLLRELFLELVGKANFTTQHQKYTLLCTLIEDICDDTDTEEDRLEALLSLQLVLGVDLEMSNTFEERRISLKSSLADAESLDPATYITEKSHLQAHADMRRDSSSTSRKLEDYTFYNVVAHLLNNTQTVVIIENAHYVDELSWKELFLMQAGDQLDMSVLLTMEVSRIPEGRYITELIGSSSPKNSNKLLNPNNRSNSSIKWDAKEGAEAETEAHDSPSKYGSADTEGDDVFPVNYPTLSSPRALQQSNNASHSTSNFSLNGSSHSTPRNGQAVGLAQQKSTGTLFSQTSNLNLDSESTPTSTLTIRSYPTEFWCSILDNPTTTVMVMGELTRDEIKAEMGRSLPKLELTDNLVDLVFTITSGNAYWCKAMTQFIKDQGAQALFAAVSDRRSRQNPLKQLVLVHFEAHTPDLQVLSKHASIIGTEFDENLLRAIVPPKLKNILTSCLDKLVEKRFIQCLDPQDRTFCFPNQLIQATLYELTPPSDAAHLHLLIAQYIETTYFLELRSHYPTLGYHYRRCPDKRPLAFKYELKAADQQVAKGAYGDGLNFLKSAAKLAEKDVELEVVLEVIDRAIEDIKEQNGQATVAMGHSTIKRLQSFYTGATDSRTNGIVLRYNALKKLVHTKLAQLKADADRLIAEEKSADRKKVMLQKARQENTGARLNWQPSYASSKRDLSSNTTGGSRSSLDGRDDDYSDHTVNTVKTECRCVIS
eukprot:CAMPEP_0185010280 /NCGR_PEP_ID=MMETSP1098-20130426/94423_1 /TAXON_ID=89044 /ORGANISM="Spumella elongata, Strain CCAP 955/1" /LENGTH=2012 /DNA_ID=CAMNT_0027539123 /DNA_START=54 /DNA_END=6092 /DNA_ORIENTATION=-